jgi:hypothetical protein
MSSIKWHNFQALVNIIEMDDNVTLCAYLVYDCTREIAATEIHVFYQKLFCKRFDSSRLLYYCWLSDILCKAVKCLWLAILTNTIRVSYHFSRIPTTTFHRPILVYILWQ